MQFLLVIFLLWFLPSKSAAADISRADTPTFCKQCDVTDFSARRRKAPVATEFRFPWDEPQQVHRVAHNKYGHKLRVRRGYISHQAAAPSFGGGLLATARSYMGTNPTGWRSLWCARFMAMIAPHAAARIKNPNMAREWASAGTRLSSCQVGALAVMARGRRGGHVGIVSACGPSGPTVVSGNHGRVVGEGGYSHGRVIAYVAI